jgi:hypothetical protein
VLPPQHEWQWQQLPAGHSSSSSSSSSSCPSRRDMAVLVLVSASQVLLFGGRSEGGKALQDTWLLDLHRCVRL